MTPIPDVTEADLHAYADGQLAPQRFAEVEAWLADNPDAAAMVADWQQQNEGIRGLFSGYARKGADDAALLQRKSEKHGRPGMQARSLLLRIAASAAILACGIAIGQAAPPLFQRGQPVTSLIPVQLSDEARSAFLIYASEMRHPVEVGASEEEHLARWLGKRLDYPLDIPDLSGIGFKLVGGRLVPVGGKPGALFMYEDAAGQRVTVLVGRNADNRSTSFRFASVEGVETFYWIDGPIGYAVTGEIPREQLQAIADECYRQFPT